MRKLTYLCLLLIISCKKSSDNNFGSTAAPATPAAITGLEIAAPAAPAAALAGIGVGNVDNGAHNYKVSFQTELGETAIGAPFPITVVNKTIDGQVQLSAIPVGPTGIVTARRLWRTPVGSTTYKLLAVLANNTETTYLDNKADTSLDGTVTALSAVWVEPGCDFEVVVGSAVALTSARSSDPAGAITSVLWTQTGGASVTLSSATATAPTFTAPAAATDLVFLLAVTGPSGSDTTPITVHVKTLVCGAADVWFAGYGNPGTMMASVTGGTGPYTFAWSGIDPWLTASGAATQTLSYTMPPLTDFQNFPDRTEVALFQRTTQGRLQLTVTVTDSLGATDTDTVNLSAGPFADSVANENVALGEPVFLNGGATTTSGAITNWSWTGTKPDGSAISFLKPNKTALAAATDQRFVYFVPTVVGPYEIILVQNPGAVVKVVTITCGKYLGIGNLLGKTPDPFIGECAACHAGQLGFLADFANPWLQTGHATMYSRILDSTNPYYGAVQAKVQWKDAFNFGSNYGIDSRTVGWSLMTAVSDNGGWAQKAVAEGYCLKGTTWDEMKRKHPQTAGRSNVQCESCHGPGSEHAGDTTGIRKSYDSTLCGRCHSRKQDLWEASSHGLPVITGSASCNGCHTAQGFIVEMRAQETSDPHPVLYAYSNLNRPVIPAEDRRGTSCQACHDPHKKTVGRPAGATEPQLRAYGNVTFRNGATSFAGDAAVCYMCHQSRTDTTMGSGDMNVRRPPHDSTAAEMLAGANAHQFTGWSYNASPHGIPSKFLKGGQTEVRQCLSCHADVSPGSGALGYNALGGHSFNMTQGTGALLFSDATHPGAATLTGTKKFTVASGASLLKAAFTGDTLVITAGADIGTYTVSSVDNARQVTLSGGAASFAGGAVTAWTVTSVKKYNVAACTQCHTTAVDFRDVARADYDGDGSVEVVQDEIAGLEAALVAAINAKLVAYTGVAATTVTYGSGRVKYNKGGTGTLRTFPGPGTTSSDNPDIAWSSLTPTQQAQWEALYRAAYNNAFVANDKSEGIHNTGYAVNLLQSAYKEVTGTTIGAPFVPFP